MCPPVPQPTQIIVPRRYTPSKEISVGRPIDVPLAPRRGGFETRPPRPRSPRCIAPPPRNVVPSPRRGTWGGVPSAMRGYVFADAKTQPQSSFRRRPESRGEVWGAGTAARAQREGDEATQSSFRRRPEPRGEVWCWGNVPRARRVGGRLGDYDPGSRPRIKLRTRMELEPPEPERHVRRDPRQPLRLVRRVDQEVLRHLPRVPVRVRDHRR